MTQPWTCHDPCCPLNLESCEMTVLLLRATHTVSAEMEVTGRDHCPKHLYLVTPHLVSEGCFSCSGCTVETDSAGFIC